MPAMGPTLIKSAFCVIYKGGLCHYNGKSYKGCMDKRVPIEDRPIVIPHQMYFGNSSGSWGGKGVAFIDPQKTPEFSTLGRMYLISEEQFKEIQEQEGSSPNWYGQLIDLGTADGYKIQTFTSRGIRPTNRPSEVYLQAISDGIKEIFPYMEELAIHKYFCQCLRG